MDFLCEKTRPRETGVFLWEKEVNMKMNPIESSKIRKTPEHRLKDALQELREINTREFTDLALRQGRRYRSLFNEFRSVYDVPDEVFVTSQVFLDTRTGEIHNRETRRQIRASDAFWGQHGYSLILRVAMASGSSTRTSSTL